MPRLNRLFLGIALACVAVATPTAQTAPRPAAAAIPSATLLRIVEAEDLRRFDGDTLGALLRDARASVRRRAALAAGRVGDAAAVTPLVQRLTTDQSTDVRAMAAFALGEIEAEAGVAALLDALAPATPVDVRGRALEALGKIGAAAATSTGMKTRIGGAIAARLTDEDRRSQPNRQLVLLALTASFRARVAESAAAAALFLDSADARIRADALNALARMRAAESLARVRTLLTADADPIVRANAARVIGGAADMAGYDPLLAAATADPDMRVRVAAIRALLLLNDTRAADALLTRGDILLAALRAAAGGTRRPVESNELLEIATALGRLLTTTDNARAIGFLRQLRMSVAAAPEVDIALARIGPAAYVNPLLLRGALGASWPQVSAIAQALGEIGSLMNLAPMVRSAAEMRVRALLGAGNTPVMAVPDLLRALQAFGPGDLAAVARPYLQAADVIVRATAAEILGTLPPDPSNVQALLAALPPALAESTNDAALALLEALRPQPGTDVDGGIQKAMASTSYVVRRTASDVIRSRGGAAPSAVPAESRERRAVYQRAIARIGRQVQAIVSTEKGAVTLELLPEHAPLTVDNFIELALLNYFEGLTFHRVVPNFVIQGGDPRGDGSGGPGYEIRCEVNLVPHDTGVIAMALSGKDTGGSQIYITHSPQPHLDGGYTVFGRVTSGQAIVDRLARGDRILSVTIVETPAF